MYRFRKLWGPLAATLAVAPPLRIASLGAADLQAQLAVTAPGPNCCSLPARRDAGWTTDLTANTAGAIRTSGIDFRPQALIGAAGYSF